MFELAKHINFSPDKRQKLDPQGTNDFNRNCLMTYGDMPFRISLGNYSVVDSTRLEQAFLEELDNGTKALRRCLASANRKIHAYALMCNLHKMYVSRVESLEVQTGLKRRIATSTAVRTGFTGKSFFVPRYTLMAVLYDFTAGPGAPEVEWICTLEDIARVSNERKHGCDLELAVIDLCMWRESLEAFLGPRDLLLPHHWYEQLADVLVYVMIKLGICKSDSNSPFFDRRVGMLRTEMSDFAMRCIGAIDDPTDQVVVWAPK